MLCYTGTSFVNRKPQYNGIEAPSADTYKTLVCSGLFYLGGTFSKCQERDRPTKNSEEQLEQISRRRICLRNCLDLIYLKVVEESSL